MDTFKKIISSLSKRTIFSVVLLTFLILLSIWVFFTNSAGKIDTISSDSQKIESNQVTVNDLIIIETKKGQKYWEVLAETGTYDKTMGKADLTNIIGNFYQNGKVVLSFEAPLAVYDRINKEITLKNNAIVVNDQGVTMTAGEICWSSEKNKIIANQKVKIVQKGKLLTTSDEAEFNADFTHLKLSGNSSSYVYK